jgi:hypothetical protein
MKGSKLNLCGLGIFSVNAYFVMLVFGLINLGEAKGSSFTFSDILNWTGTGDNQAGLIIDWRDGKDPQCLAWGYRWTGTKTTYDMIKDITDSDPWLSMSATWYYTIDSEGNDFGWFLDRFAYTKYSHDETFRTITDSEGIKTYFYWVYYEKQGDDDWTDYSSDLLSYDVLIDGQWAGFSYGTFPETAPSRPVAPEPASLALLSIGVIGLIRKRFI